MNTPNTTTRAPAVQIMRKLGLEPDPWQIEVLEAGHPSLLLNCCRQAGKSTVVALLVMAEAVFVPGTRVLLLSRSQRQSTELFRVLLEFYDWLGAPLEKRRTVNELELKNFSRVVSLPCKEETIRGYAKISLLIIDEAARVPDDLYRAVRPMLAVSGGRLVCLSTPYGKRGFFHDAWANGGEDWARIEVPAEQIARISDDFLRTERRALGESWFRQEYCCSFEALEGLVYPDLSACVVSKWPGQETGPQRGVLRKIEGRRVGGIDFGFRNPFAAIWGTLDADGVLWLTAEHYKRSKPLSYHATKLPRDVMWFADPSGANERCELQCAGFTVRAGNNSLRPGISRRGRRANTGSFPLRSQRLCVKFWIKQSTSQHYRREIMSEVKIRNRIKEHRRVRAGDLVPHEWNFRLHPDEQKATLAALYEQVGFACSLLAYELPDGRLKLIDGHLRRDIDPDMEVDVEVLDVNEEEARTLLLSIDPLAELAETQSQLHQRLMEQTPVESQELQTLWQRTAQAALEERPTRDFKDFIGEFYLLITCKEEKQQTELLERFHAEGLECRAVLS